MKNRQWLLELATGGLATAVLAFVALRSSSPPLAVVIPCALTVIAAEHSLIRLPSATVSPSFMVVMASIALLDDSSRLLSTMLIAAPLGLYLNDFRRRLFGQIVFNCAQFALAAVAAAATFSLFPASSGALALIAAIAATLVFGAVNIPIVVWRSAMLHEQRPAVVWASMGPAVPNYLAFGLLGLLLGQLGISLGPATIVLLAVPMLIGRFTFASFTRLRDAHESTIRIFIRLIESKDAYTAGHAERVAKYSHYMAEALDVSPSRYEHLRHSALMHDVGKLAVPNRLLNKPGRLTEEEFSIVQRHNDVCVDILGRVDFMRDMTVIASDSHGRFENSEGRPDHDLVLEAHIVAVADAFDAMTSTRSYRKALDQDVAFAELRKNAGTQFNPACVEALIAAIEKRAERYGAGHESDAHEFAVPPPEAGVGSAGLGHFEDAAVNHQAGQSQ